ncbi:hypothetical protein AAJCM20276_05040 [Acetobacter aceti]|uniref:Uncharacterized protein n=1 Tax=Acetobacter aceti TaxID=435 RepID=A0A6S6PG01_ACEAC|nr:hypothetical protein [Acetobacter aceti]BCI65880.1 hypothetical protein AAJCM20276_05040 [Acetobacter aceti]
MTEVKKPLFTSFGIINFQENIVLNEGGQLFEANRDGEKSDKSFSINLDDDTNIYAYVNQGKISFYKSGDAGEPGEWMFHLHPDGRLFTRQMKERKKLLKEQKKKDSAVQKTDQQEERVSENGRKILTLSGNSGKNTTSNGKSPVVVEVRKKKHHSFQNKTRSV